MENSVIVDSLILIKYVSNDFCSCSKIWIGLKKYIDKIWIEKDRIGTCSFFTKAEGHQGKDKEIPLVCKQE